MSELDNLLDTAIDEGIAPGLVAMAAKRDGTCYQYSAGLLSAASDAPMMHDAIFWLASMTKLVTSIAALQLVEQKRLTLDEPLAPLLPQLAIARVLEGFDAAGDPILRAPRRSITLRHLLTHTAGFGYDLMNPQLMRSRGGAGPPSFKSLDSLNGPLLFDPGERWEYGVSTDWVGLLVEAASGEPLDRYFECHIFAPLAMVDTTFDVPAAKRDRMAPLHVRQPEGGFTAISSPLGVRGDWAFFSGGAGLLGTASDYLRLLRAVLGGGALGQSRVLESSSVVEMLRCQTGSIRAGKIGTAAPTLYHPFDQFPGMMTGWGLSGLIVPEDVSGRRRAGTMSWCGAANTFYWVDPTSDLCAVLMLQQIPFGDARALNLLRRFERAVYREFGIAE